MLHRFYSFLVSLTETLLPVAAVFSGKMKLFVNGRKTVFDNLKTAFEKHDKVIWIHAASLGEYEQGLPVMKKIKQEFPRYKILLTFFSPSGYEVKKGTALADFTSYLPLDTNKNAKRFVAIVQPEMAIFIKYEIWPNYIKALKSNGAKVLLISALFRPNQFYFQEFAAFFQQTLRSFDQCFVQNEPSLKLLQSIGVKNVSISGDTRFDRVSQQIEQNNTLDFIEDFLMKYRCVVCGSTWPEDEAILLDFINSKPAEIKFIIVPHSLNLRHLKQLQERITQKSVLFSERKAADLAKNQVLIIDNIGMLSKIYYYADVAYVGGGMGSLGLHNILEPATFGVPIVIGRNFTKFPEATQLRKMGGLFSVDNAIELEKIMLKLLSEEAFRKQTGMIAGHFVQANTGATKIILEYLKKVLRFL